jgi:geranylgeranyl diphosphate synthase type I
MVSNYQNNKNLAKIIQCYNDIVIDTVKGEILDVYLPFIEKNNKKHKLKEEDIMEIYRLKTSMYTIVGPFVLGMILSDNKEKTIEDMKEILLPLGIAFQIKDDIIGIFNSTDVIGKPNYSDIEEFKQTILYSYIKTQKTEYLDKLLEIYGKSNINEEEYNEVKQILIDSGSLEYANNKMIELFNESKEKLSKYYMNQEVKNILLGFIKYLELRKK